MFERRPRFAASLECLVSALSAVFALGTARISAIIPPFFMQTLFSSFRRFCFSAAFLATLATAWLGFAAEDPFAAGVRPTNPLSPEEQQRTFHLPPGFEIELVASEPKIAKPMNLAFDARGRLWMTDSYEYPFAAPLDRPGRDSIKVIEDADGDGRYDTVSTFADGLNIPIGLYPYKNGVVAWSIPNIWHFEDTNDDGKADRRTKLYGPLGYEHDTHGMHSSFTRGFDGWLYITHGFNNYTTVRGRDGSEISMHSGNTYRVRLDGSRAEHFTFGQVNPFGMAQDPLGDLYTSDCHSMPAYLLIRDAYYPSFGKPHDGLGFCPKIMEHNHGSTALDGIVHYSGNQWPAEFRDNIFIGNVMTSRVNRDALLETGAGKRAVKKEDFIRSDDPWFRPVHMQFGPDGSLYIADFYNRIIGHYEVSLQHPGRDRHRGRIWKVSFAGIPGQSPQSPKPFDLTKLSISGLHEELKSGTITRRQLAMNYLIDEVGAASLTRAQSIVAGSEPSTWQQRAHALWILHRLDGLDPKTLLAAASDFSREVRIHAMKILAETHPWSNAHCEIGLAGLKDVDFHVRRAAADALSQHPDARHVESLLSALAEVADSDPFLKHALRIALRNQLRESTVFDAIRKASLTSRDADAVADVLISIQTQKAANFLLDYLSSRRPTAATVRQFAGHIARHASAADLDRLPPIIETIFAKDLDQQLAVFEALDAGRRQRGAAFSAAIKNWIVQLAGRLMHRVEQSRDPWIHRPIPGMPPTKVPWILQQRRSADGDEQSAFLSSLSPGGESFTGILSSQPFSLPAKLSFFLAGHDGHPDKPAQNRNHIRLRLVDDNRIIASANPPRNDTAQQVTWNLAPFRNQQAYFEIIDGNDGGGWAWLAFGRLWPDLVALPDLSPQNRSLLLVSASKMLADSPQSAPYAKALSAIRNPKNPPTARSQMAVELCRSRSNPFSTALAKRIADSALAENQRQNIGRQLFAPNPESSLRSLARDLLSELPLRSQRSFIQDLGVNQKGAKFVLQLAEEETIPATLLQNGKIQEQIRNHGQPLSKRLQALIQNLPATHSNRNKAIQQISRNLGGKNGNQEEGRRLFNQACQICHQLAGQGALIGPQLDGVGNRGLERLLEDILAPNRNLDKAFHTHTLTLSNGDALTGLHQRDDGVLAIFVNAAGQEFSIPKQSIIRQQPNPKSIMPDNFIEILSEDQIANLTAFLLSPANRTQSSNKKNTSPKSSDKLSETQ